MKGTRKIQHLFLCFSSLFFFFLPPPVFLVILTRLELQILGFAV